MRFSLPLALILMSFCGPVKAWVPCMPFCDTACSGPAMMQFTTDTIYSITQYQTTCTQLTSKLSDNSIEMSNFTADLTDSIFMKHTNFVTALDGMASKLSISIAGRAKVHAAMADIITSTFVSNIRSQSNIESIVDTDAMFGESAQYSHPYLSREICSDCAIEPIMMLQNAELSAGLLKSKLAWISYESSGIAMDSVLKTREQSVWVTEKYDQPLSPMEKARMTGLLSDARDPISSPRGDAIRKLRAVVQAIQLSETAKLEVDGYEQSNLATFIDGKSFDSLLRGVEAYSIAGDNTRVMGEMDHALLLRLAISQTAKNISLFKLNRIGSYRNILLSLDSIEERNSTLQH